MYRHLAECTFDYSRGPETKYMSAVLSGVHALLVISHKEAKVYLTEAKGSTSEQITPEGHHGHFSHVHSSHDYSDHIEKPNHKEFFEAITKSLETASQILIFGSGGGSSNMMGIYVEWLNAHHHTLAERLVGSVVVDQSHLTEGEILAKARDFYKAL